MNTTNAIANPTLAPEISERDLLDRISKARVRLVARVPFFGYLAMQLRPRMARPEDDISTAGIAPDGTTYFNSAFVAGLSDKELCGVVAHEVMHPALFFWGRKVTRHHLLFNIAHDLSFNFLIEEMAGGEIVLPDGCLLDEKFHGMAAEEIYQHLLKGDNGSGKTEIKVKGGGSITVDVNGNGGDAFGDCREDLSTTKDGKKSSQGDSSASKRLENKWKLDLASAAQQHEARKTQGKLPAGLKRLIEEMLHPKLDWTEQLARWCGDNGKREEYSFRRPSRRSQSVGSTLPSMCAGGFADVIYLIDSSGSMSDKELKQALAEASGILDEMGCEIRVLVCDAAVHTDMSVEEALDIEIAGGGGSDFCPAFELLDEEGFDGAVIAFTDGMISVPDEKPINLKGCLWVTPERYSAPSEGSWGDHITVPDDGDEGDSDY